MSHESRRYAIFAATSGIGTALARQLAAEGAQLLLIARNPEKIAPLAEETGATTATADLTRLGEVEAVLQGFSSLDGVVNCAGSLLLKPAHLTSEAEWADTVAANLTSAFFVVRAAAKAMMATGGSIGLVSSSAARLGIPNHEAIAAAKAGVIGLTLSAAATYAPRHIRVNCVAPGLVESPLTARITSNEAALKASTAMHALGRIGHPADVAAALAWFLDPAQSWVTGQVLGVDGGLGSLRGR